MGTPPVVMLILGVFTKQFVVPVHEEHANNYILA